MSNGKTIVGLLAVLSSGLVVAQSWQYDLNPYSYSSSFSFTVLFLAAAHAVPILVVASATNNRLLTVLATIGMVYVAIAFGGPAYAIADLFFVALSAFLSVKVLTDSIEQKKSNAQAFDLVGEDLVERSSPPPTIEETRSLLIRDAEANDIFAQKLLGSLLLDGENTQCAYGSDFDPISFSQDIELGLYWTKRAIAAGGGGTHLFCRFFYNQLCFEKPNLHLLEQFIELVTYTLQYENSEENRWLQRELLFAQALAIGDTEGSSKILIALRRNYYAKYVKGG